MEQQEQHGRLHRRIEQLVEELETFKQSGRYYRDLFDEAPEVMFLADLDGNILSANRSALRVTGYSEEEVKELPTLQLVSREASDRLTKQLKDVFESSQSNKGEYKLLRKGGGTLWVDLELKPVREGPETVAVQIIARDASERDFAEQALKCARENLERALNGLPDAVLVESADHVIQFVNNAAKSLFGNIKGKRCYDVLGMQEVSPHCAVEEVIANRTSLYRTTHHREGRVWEITGVPMLHADGTTSVLEVVKDVTANREIQEKLKASEKLEILGRVAAEMAHEIKNPLSAITTFAQLLPEKYDDEEFRQVFTRTATQSVKKINYLMEELTGFARPIKPVLEETNVRDVVEQALMIVHQQLANKSVHLTRDLPREPLIAPVDSEQLKRVIAEILSNSADAAQQGGNVSVSARFVRDSSHAPPRKLEIVISDDGHGIAPENLKRIFEPFFTTSSDKLGLGLAIAQRIVQDHNGSITVDSQPGKGATFTISLRMN